MAYHIRVSESDFQHEAKAQDDLARILGNEWLILSNPQRTRTGAEIDCLVLGPRGLINIELKNWADNTVADDGGRWQFNGKDATYKSKNGTQERLRPDPVKQAQNAARSFKEHFKAEHAISLWVDYCTLAGPLGIKLDYKDLKVKDIARPLQEAAGLLERRIERGKTDHKLGCVALTRENALAVLKHFSVDQKPDAQQWLMSAFRGPTPKSKPEPIKPPPPPQFRETAESPRRIKSAPPSPVATQLKLDASLQKLFETKNKYKSINGAFIFYSFLYIFPIISHSISILFASEIPEGSRIQIDILTADVEFFILPVINWFGTLLTTVVHTVTLPFSENSQGYAVWIGHLSALALFWIFWQIRSHSWVGIVPALVAVGLAAATFVMNRDRPGDRELDAIIQQIGFRTYSNTLNFPNQPGNVTFTLTSDGDSLKLDSLSAGNTCSYLVSADGLQGSRVALELEVVEGDCRKLTGEVYSNGEVIDFDLFTGNNRRVPMQFRINLKE
jgi:Nuclease-related domain